MRRIAGRLFIDHRGKAELILTLALLVAFLTTSFVASNYEETLTKQTRASLYGSLTGSTAALLGFVLTALAILVALPSTDRLDALRGHPKWPRVPNAYLRAAYVLLAALVLCTVGIPLDSDVTPWRVYEAVTVTVTALALARVAGAVIALDQIIAVARQRAPRPSVIDDPGL